MTAGQQLKGDQGESSAGVLTGILAIIVTVVIGFLALASDNHWFPFRGDVPAAPQRLTGASSFDGVRLTWAPSADATEYQLYRDKEIIYVGKNTEYVDKAVEPGKTYTYYVVAVGRTGRLSEQTVTDVTITRPSATLRPPTALTVGAVAARSVQLAWSPTAGQPIGPFSILRDGAKVGEATTDSFVDSTVQPSTIYVYTVRSVDSAKKEESPSSEPVTVRTPADSGGGGGNTTTTKPAPPPTLPSPTKPSPTLATVVGRAPLWHMFYDWTSGTVIDFNAGAPGWAGKPASGGWTNPWDIAWHTGSVTSAAGTAGKPTAGEPWAIGTCAAHYDDLSDIPEFTPGLRFCLYVEAGYVGMVEVLSVSSGSPAVARVEIAVWDQ